MALEVQHRYGVRLVRRWVVHVEPLSTRTGYRRRLAWMASHGRTISMGCSWKESRYVEMMAVPAPVPSPRSAATYTTAELPVVAIAAVAWEERQHGSASQGRRLQKRGAGLTCAQRRGAVPPPGAALALSLSLTRGRANPGASASASTRPGPSASPSLGRRHREAAGRQLSCIHGLPSAEMDPARAGARGR